MRVLHVYKTYYPDSLGGVEQVLLQLTTGLAAKGVDNRVFVLSPDAQPSVIDRPESDVVRCQQILQIASTPISLSAISAFRAHLEWADVVHYQHPWPFADLLHLISGSPKASVVTYQSDVVRQRLLMQLYRPLMMRFLRSVGSVVATSPNYLATSPVLRQLNRSVDVIPNGLAADSRLHVLPEKLAYWRSRLGDGFFLFVGVLRYYKGLHVLVEAARTVSHPIVIAGDGPEYPALVAQVSADGLTHVKLIGRITEEDKAALLLLALAFVFPSNIRSEAFGMSLVEAASRGLPMLSCEIGTGTSFVNLNGETGITVPPNDPKALSDAMAHMLSNQTQTLKMGQCAKRRYEELFTAEVMADRYLSLYTRLCLQADHCTQR